MSASKTLALIEETRSLDKAATPGPWTHTERGRVFVPKHLITEGYVAYPGGNDPDEETPETLAAEALTERNGELIARYRTLAPKLADALEAALRRPLLPNEGERNVRAADAADEKGAPAEDAPPRGDVALREVRPEECGEATPTRPVDGGPDLPVVRGASAEELITALREERQNAEGLRERLAEAERRLAAIRDTSETWE